MKSCSGPSGRDRAAQPIAQPTDGPVAEGDDGAEDDDWAAEWRAGMVGRAKQLKQGGSRCQREKARTTDVK